MAEMPRRTWKEILAEAKRCCGGVQYAGFEDRLKYWLTDAYYRVCLTYHHYELHQEGLQTQKAGLSYIGLWPHMYIVMSVVEVEKVEQAGFPDFYRPTRVLQNRNNVLRQGVFRTLSARPASYARAGTGGGLIHFDSILDVERTYLVSYYKQPDAPDFDAATSYPVISRIWDEQIIDMALVRIGARTWSQDLMVQGQQLLSDYLGQQVQPAQVDQANADLPETPRSDQPQGGLQG